MIYLDYCATTPCAKEVIKAMQPYFRDQFGNPSSSHVFGRIAKSAIEKARSQVAMLLNCGPAEVVFTSGATESNNLLFLGLLLDQHEKRKKIVVSSIEHKSVLEPARFLATRGFELVLLPVSSGGIVDLDAARRLINNDTALVSVHAANNEIGTIQPIKDLAEIAHSVGALFHTDATQALGKIPFDVQDVDCDLASFSAHKCYGPKGIGALYVRGGIKRWKWEFPFHGGGQENGLRPGTHNVPAIVGFGEACNLVTENLSDNKDNLFALTTVWRKEIMKAFPAARVHGCDRLTLPGVICVTIPSLMADMMTIGSLEHCISHGSACNSGAISTSHVLRELGLNDQEAESTIRISINSSVPDNAISSLIKNIKKFVIKDGD
jgi:cysteine desulfurase